MGSPWLLLGTLFVRMGLLVCLLVLCVSLVGCGIDDDLARDESGPGTVVEKVAQHATSVMEHHFGYVLPESRHVHRFRVRNDTDRLWSVKMIHVKCACTVAEAASSMIRPGESSEFAVAYRAGVDSGNERRSVLIEFEEPGVQPIELVVRANVRNPLTVSSKELVFSSVGMGHDARESIDIFNYSDSEWDSLLVEPSKGWLTVKTEQVKPVPESESAVRQAWRSVVEVQTRKLDPGKYQAELHVRPKNTAVEPSIVAVELTVTSPMKAIPGDLFFGRAKVGESVCATTAVLLAADMPAVNARRVSISHNLGERLDVNVEQVSDRKWTLRATLVAEHAGLLEGTITITPETPGVPELNAPLMCHVTDE